MSKITIEELDKNLKEKILNKETSSSNSKASFISIDDINNVFEANNVEDALLENKKHILNVEKNSITIKELESTESEIKNVLYFPNLLLNGNFNINQEGILNHSDFQNTRRRYVCDMWIANTLNDSYLTNLFVNKLKNRLITKAVNGFELGQYIPSDTLKFLIGKTVTLSFHVDTITSCECKLSIYNSNSDANVHKNVVINKRNQIISATFEIPSTSAEDWSYVCFEIVNSKNEDGWFDIYYGKLEINDRATKYVPVPYEQDLLNCKRFYEKVYVNRLNTLYSRDWLHFHINIVEKYVEPTVTCENFKIKGTYTGNEISGFTLNAISKTRDWIQFDVYKASHGLTVGTVDTIYIADARLW